MSEFEFMNLDLKIMKVSTTTTATSGSVLVPSDYSKLRDLLSNPFKNQTNREEYQRSSSFIEDTSGNERGSLAQHKRSLSGMAETKGKHNHS
jgi:hypothetical protein